MISHVLSRGSTQLGLRLNRQVGTLSRLEHRLGGLVRLRCLLCTSSDRSAVPDSDSDSQLDSFPSVDEILSGTATERLRELERVDEESPASGQQESTGAVVSDESSQGQTASAVDPGTVISCLGDVIVVAGMESASPHSMIQFDGGATALVTEVGTAAVHAPPSASNSPLVAAEGQPTVSCLLLSGSVKQGERGAVLAEPARVPVAVGRVIDPLGRPLDGRAVGYLAAAPKPPVLPVKQFPAGQRARRPTASAPSGVKVIDALAPIGRGQSIVLKGQPGQAASDLAVEILGCLSAGRSRSSVDPAAPAPEAGAGAGSGATAHHSQVLTKEDPVFVVVLTGQSAASCARTIARLRTADLMPRCVLVAAPQEACAGQRYLAPLAGAAAASQLRSEGRHAVLIVDRLLSASDPVLGSGFPLGRAGAALGPAPPVPREYAAVLDACGDVDASSSKSGSGRGGKAGSVTGILLVESPGTAGIAGGEASWGRQDILRRALGSDLASLADASLTVHQSLAELGQPVPLDEEELAGRQGGAWQGRALQALSQSVKELLRRSGGAASHALKARAVGVEVEPALDGALAFNARAQVLLSPSPALELEASRARSLQETIQAGLGSVRRGRPAGDEEDRAAASIEMGSSGSGTGGGAGAGGVHGGGGEALGRGQGTSAGSRGGGGNRGKYAAALSPAQRDMLERRQAARKSRGKPVSQDDAGGRDDGVDGGAGQGGQTGTGTGAQGVQSSLPTNAARALRSHDLPGSTSDIFAQGNLPQVPPSHTASGTPSATGSVVPDRENNSRLPPARMPGSSLPNLKVASDRATPAQLVATLFSMVYGYAQRVPIRQLAEFERALWHTLASLPAPPMYHQQEQGAVQDEGRQHGGVSSQSSSSGLPASGSSQPGDFDGSHAWVRFASDCSPASLAACEAWEEVWGGGDSHWNGDSVALGEGDHPIARPRSLLEAAYMCGAPMEPSGCMPGERLAEAVLSSRSVAREAAVAGRARALAAQQQKKLGAGVRGDGASAAAAARRAGVSVDALGPAVSSEHLRVLHPVWRAMHRVAGALADSFAAQEAARIHDMEFRRAAQRQDKLAEALARAAEEERLAAEAAGPKSPWPSLSKLLDFRDYSRLLFATDATRARARAQAKAEKNAATEEQGNSSDSGRQ